MEKEFKIALCQMNVSDNKKKNIEKAVKMIEEAVNLGADIITLPEIFNCPYDSSKFASYAETIDNGETVKAISQVAKAHRKYIVAGSIPEKEGSKIYNTSIIFSPDGEIIAKHRKIHLFDIDIEDKIKFYESDVLSSGNDITVFDTEYCKIGVCICYDMRFPELFRLMVEQGVRMVIVPAAFNMTTGPAHWEPLIRVRALDNQIYIVAVSPARDEFASYVAFGNSMIAGPWGEIIGKLDEKENILIKKIDLSKVRKVRSQLPLLKHRRTDIYNIVKKGNC